MDWPTDGGRESRNKPPAGSYLLESLQPAESLEKLTHED
jgi:hypothetical protein